MNFYVPWLVDCARAAAAGTGKQVIASPGWESRGHGGMRVVEGVVGHHTATPETAPGDYPSLNVVQNGRSDLAGPLSHYGLGRSGNIYVIATGLCYHAGASAYAGFVDLNDEFLGIEAEDSGDGVWTDAQLFMYPRLVRACLDYMNRGVDRYASHRTVAVPAGRKNDPWGISDDWMRQHAAAAWNQQGQQEDDVSFQEQLVSAWNPSYKTSASDWITTTAAKVESSLANEARMEAKIDALSGSLSDDEANIIAAMRAVGGDPEAVAQHLAPLLSGITLGRLPDDQFKALIDAVNDEHDRREAVRASTPVPAPPQET